MVENKHDSVTADYSLAQRTCKPGICIVLPRTSADTQCCCHRKLNLWLLRLQFCVLLGNCVGSQQCLMWAGKEKGVELSDDAQSPSRAPAFVIGFICTKKA